MLTKRPEQSDLFSQRTRGKITIRLEKPAVNISKPTGGENEKATWKLYMKNFGQIYILFKGNNEWKSK